MKNLTSRSVFTTQKHSFRAPAVLSAAVLSLAVGLPALQAQVINLSAPVSESLTPTGIYWAFDGGSLGASTPNPVVDGSGNGFEGTLLAGDNSMPVYKAGRFGTAIDLAPPVVIDSQSPHVNWGGASSYSGQLDFVDTSFTFGAWLQLGSMELSNSPIYLMERGQSVSMSNVISFTLRTWGGGQYYPYLEVGNGVDSNYTVSFDYITLSVDVWNHIGFSYDLDAGEVKFWWNGVNSSTQVLDYELMATTTASQRQFTVGERNVPSYFGGVDGTIDDVFLTSGVYAFDNYSVPEPSAVALVIGAGVWAGVVGWRRRASRVS